MSAKHSRTYRRTAYYQEWKNRPEVKAKIKAYLKAYHKEYGKKPEVIEHKRDLTLRRVYGITLQDYNQLLQQQDYKCAICFTPQIELDRSLAVDHNHNTGKVRGLLCGTCNRYVVMALERPVTVLKSALDYLEAHGDKVCL